MGFYMRSPVYTPNDPVKSVKQLHSWVYQLNENLKFMFSNLDSENFSDDFTRIFSSEEMQKIKLDIEKMESAISDLMKKAEWAPLAVTGLTPGTDENEPSLLNTGTCVFLSGSGAMGAELLAGERRSIAMLPAGSRPLKAQSQAIFAGNCKADLEALPSGAIAIHSRDESPIPQGALIPLSMTFGL